ncbi:hypothetical protein ACQ4LE_004440 [Meloidogyne hapla]|uniref:PAP-associated domain-containing protein n=1 Tax=Meloidogyne hapla TaxID=6305 RepID=A0A1I8B6T6_MELHA
MLNNYKRFLAYLVIKNRFNTIVQMRKFNSMFPKSAAYPLKRSRNHPKYSIPVNEGEQHSLIGVILKYPLEENRNMENDDGNLNNHCAEFLVYQDHKASFTKIVQLKADGLISCIPPGSWIRIILTNAVSHKLLKSNTILIPKKVLFCQRRVMTRCFDGQVSFAVTATRRNDICNENKFVYHSRLCDLLIDKEELIDPLIKIFGKQCEINNNNLKNEKENDDIPTKIRLWCFPFIENKEDSQLEFKLKHIDERYYTAIDTTENEYINDEKQIIINSSNDDSDCNNLNEQQQFSINFCKWFSECIERFYIKNKMNNDRKIKMDKFINLLNKKLQNNLDLPNEAKLILFGSAISGFGSNDCDLDICLINCGIDSSLNTSIFKELRLNILFKIRNLLREDKEFSKVFLLKHARTPIIEFEYLPSGFNCDICIEHQLAIHNSELLKLYTEFDERVAPLGFAIKCWAKLYGINDASTGSISSYAYIVMLIYYLQRCSPPILPFLQQEEFIINNNSLLVNKIVEGWKVYYTKDINLIKENFKSKFTNKQTLAELFLNFLHFYGFKFSFISNIAQIRANGLYDKIQANISIKRKIYVEDPFDLNHNLTSGVSSETLNHFIKCCQQPIIGLRQLDKEIFSLNETKDDENNKLEKEKLKMDFAAIMFMYRPCNETKKDPLARIFKENNLI